MIQELHISEETLCKLPFIVKDLHTLKRACGKGKEQEEFLMVDYQKFLVRML
jgi:hypothetical protein